MQKQKKQIIVLVVFLIICIAAYAGTRVYNTKTADHKKKESEAKITHLAKIKAKDITAITYTYNGASVSLSYTNGAWIDAADASVKMDQSAIETMLSNLADVKATDKIEKYDDTKTYGFDSPALTLDVTTKDKTYAFKFGATNSMVSSTYLMMDKDTTVYLVDTTLETAFEKTVDELKATQSTEASTSTTTGQ